MKQCPVCNRTYQDSLSFCLEDGTLLITDSEQATVVIPPPAKPRKSRALMWLGLVGLLALAVVSVGGGLLFYNFGSQNDNTRAKRQNIANTQTTPTTQKVAPTTAPTKNAPIEEYSEKTEIAKPTASAEAEDAADAEDITPIAWDTSAAGFKGEAGTTYKFRCPKDGTEYYIYGNDVYTQDSSICTAAVHAGLFSLAEGGVVTIEYRPGRATYGSTVRNGIKSRTWGEYPRSFVVR